MSGNPMHHGKVSGEYVVGDGEMGCDECRFINDFCGACYILIFFVLRNKQQAGDHGLHKSKEQLVIMI